MAFKTHLWMPLSSSVPQADVYTAENIQKKDHGDGLLQPFLDVPAGGITVVREDGVDARDGLLRLLLVELVFGPSILLLDGQHA